MLRPCASPVPMMVAPITIARLVPVKAGGRKWLSRFSRRTVQQTGHLLFQIFVEILARRCRRLTRLGLRFKPWAQPWLRIRSGSRLLRLRLEFRFNARLEFARWCSARLYCPTSRPVAWPADRLPAAGLPAPARGAMQLRAAAPSLQECDRQSAPRARPSAAREAPVRWARLAIHDRAG